MTWRAELDDKILIKLTACRDLKRAHRDRAAWLQKKDDPLQVAYDTFPSWRCLLIKRACSSS